jgi:hypothetical protein
MEGRIMNVLKAILVLTAVVAFAAPVLGAVKTDYFDGVIGADGAVVPGTGQNTGWNGEWIYYNETNWWNEWFYDDPPDPTRWKHIEWNLCAVPQGANAYVEICINWSTVGFPATGPGGTPPMPVQEMFIERSGLIYSGPGCESVIGSLDIMSFNPEWVSIDIRGVDMQVVGCITHECVPEPATMSLLVLAGLALIRRRMT